MHDLLADHIPSHGPEVAGQHPFGEVEKAALKLHVSIHQVPSPTSQPAASAEADQ
jgi:hypothetical protein